MGMKKRPRGAAMKRMDEKMCIALDSELQP
jgi:hypothetical protein